MFNKYLTCRTYLKACDDFKVVARLEPRDRKTVNYIITEPGETTEVLSTGRTIQLSPDKHYLVGEIADRLYAYEQLGYSPEELEKIIAELKRLTAVTSSVAECKTVATFKNADHIYIMPARQNGKSMLDGYKAQLAMYDYLVNDVDQARVVAQYGEWLDRNARIGVNKSLEIDKVIFNEPATIVFWKDGTKTVVKATNEEFDPEKGLAMAISKKALGNKHDYYNVFKRWLKKYKKNTFEMRVAVVDCEPVHDAFRQAANNLKKLAKSLSYEEE